MGAKAQFLLLVLLAAFACLAPLYAPAQPQQEQEAQDVLQAQRGHNPDQSSTGMDRRATGGDNPIVLSEKQRKNLLHANLVKSRKDAAELAVLARQLREELDKPNVKTLSPDGMYRLDKIEKLAKKIRDELKAY
jgi:hypothetical protein